MLRRRIHSFPVFRHGIMFLYLSELQQTNTGRLKVLSASQGGQVMHSVQNFPGLSCTIITPIGVG
jgi:hypothetical protein